MFRSMLLDTLTAVYTTLFWGSFIFFHSELYVNPNAEWYHLSQQVERTLQSPPCVSASTPSSPSFLHFNSFSFLPLPYSVTTVKQLPCSSELGALFPWQNPHPSPNTPPSTPTPLTHFLCWSDSVWSDANCCAAAVESLPQAQRAAQGFTHSWTEWEDLSFESVPSSCVCLDAWYKLWRLYLGACMEAHLWNYWARTKHNSSSKLAVPHFK